MPLRIIDRALRATTNVRHAPAVDRATLLMHLLASRAAAGATWDHLRATWPRLEATMPPILLARLAAETASALPLDRLDEIGAFFARHPLAAGTRTLRQLEDFVERAALPIVRMP